MCVRENIFPNDVNAEMDTLCLGSAEQYMNVNVI